MTLSKGFIYNVPHSVRPHTARKTYWLQLSEINPRVSLETNTNVLKTTLAGFICYYYSIQSNCDRKGCTGNESKRFKGERNGRAHRGHHKVHSFTSSLILLLTWVNILLYNFRTSDLSPTVVSYRDSEDSGITPLFPHLFHNNHVKNCNTDYIKRH